MKKQNLSVPGCNKTKVEHLVTGDDFQVLKVDVAPGGEIPFHSHSCAATMLIIQGSAKVLGKTMEYTKIGDVIKKAPNESHGFVDISEPFSFISISYGKGILQDSKWDMNFS
jgi:quercetin dioxygenase-like cupin family protein